MNAATSAALITGDDATEDAVCTEPDPFSTAAFEDEVDPVVGRAGDRGTRFSLVLDFDIVRALALEAGER
jgi:hypothetical protein